MIEARLTDGTALDFISSLGIVWRMRVSALDL